MVSLGEGGAGGCQLGLKHNITFIHTGKKQNDAPQQLIVLQVA